MFIVFGQRLGPANIRLIDRFPLQTTLEGTSIKVTVGGTTVDALMIYTLASQLAAILPSNTPVGTGTLTVTYNGQTSAPLSIRVVRSSWGTFSVNQAGSGPGILQNFLTQENQPINALTRPARPGQTVILWGTGLGPVTANEVAGPVPGDLPINVEVYVGGRLATVTYKGRSGCCAGIDQIVFTVPEGVEGCYVPVVVKIGEAVSNFTTIAVGRGNACVDPQGVGGDALERAQATGQYRVGSVGFVRTQTKFEIPGVGSFDSKQDFGGASFDRFDLDRLLRSQGAGNAFGGVSLGACTVFTFRGESGENVDPVQPDVLDAGPVINVTGPRGAKQLTKQTGGSYGATLGGGISGIPGQPPAEPDYLEPGSYTVDNGSGGRDVGAFRSTLTLPPSLTWENMAGVANITRSAGQEITWSGGDPAGFVYITGGSTNGNLYGGFVCLERTSARRFNIPGYVLLNLPPTTGDDIGLLSVSGVGAIVNVTPPPSGLDVLTISASSGSAKNVSYR